MGLRDLDQLIGEWTLEATHPAFPDLVVPGRSSFEWLDGGKFMMQRSTADHPDFPNSISVIGAMSEGEALVSGKSKLSLLSSGGDVIIQGGPMVKINT